MLGTLNNQSGAGSTTMSGYVTPINTSVSSPAASSVPVASVGGTSAGSAASTLGAQPMIMLFALIALVLVAKWATETRGEGLELAHIHVGGYNFLMITVLAIVGIDVMKLIFTRWNVPGLTPVIQMA